MDSSQKEVQCQYCDVLFKIDDGITHVQYNNMEQSGYDFEKGRIRAQTEMKKASNKKEKHSFWF